MFWNDTDIQGSIEVLSHRSKLLEGNPLNDPVEREIFVYLPPSYKQSNRDFPVIYCLSGFAGRGKKYLRDATFFPGLHKQFEQVLEEEENTEEALIVFPDCMTSYGGSQYLNSSAVGPYESYITDEVVPFVDEKLRTKSTPENRAIMGKSSGGYGALRLGMKYPDQFRVVASHSGDMMFRYSYMPDFPTAIDKIQQEGSPKQWLKKFLDKDNKGKHDFPVFNIIAMAACYSPDPEEPGEFQLPFDLKTGKFRPDVWERWEQHDPINMLDRYQDSLHDLSCLYFDCGNHDEFNLHIGARHFHQKLDQKGIDHEYEEFDGGHMKTRYRYPIHLKKITTHF